MAQQEMIKLAHYLKYQPFPEKIIQNLSNSSENYQKWNFTREKNWLNAVISLIEFGADPEPVIDHVIQLIDCPDPSVLTLVYKILNHIATNQPSLSLLAVNKVLIHSSQSNSAMTFHMNLALEFLSIICEKSDPPTMVKDCFNEIKHHSDPEIKKHYYIALYNSLSYNKFIELKRLEKFTSELLQLFNSEQDFELVRHTINILIKLIDQKLINIELSSLGFIEYILLNMRFSDSKLVQSWIYLLYHCWTNCSLEDTTWLLLRIEDLIAGFHIQINRNPIPQLYLIVSSLYHLAYDIIHDDLADKEIWRRFLTRNKSKFLKFLSVPLKIETQLEILNSFVDVFTSDIHVFVEDYSMLFSKENTNSEILQIKLSLLTKLINADNFIPIFEYICSIYPQSNIPIQEIINIMVTIAKGSEHQFNTLLNHLLLQMESSVSKSESHPLTKDPLFSLHLIILSKLYLINKPLINHNIMETIILNCCTAEWDKLTPQGIKACLDLIGWYGADNPSIINQLESVLINIQRNVEDEKCPLDSFIFCVISLTYRYPTYYQSLLFTTTQWAAVQHPNWKTRSCFQPIFTKLFPKENSDLNHSGLCTLSDIEPDKLYQNLFKKFKNLKSKSKNINNTINIPFEINLGDCFVLDPIVYSMNKKEFDYLWSSYNTSIRRPVPGLKIEIDIDNPLRSREEIETKFQFYSIFTLEFEIINETEYRWKGYTFEKKQQCLILLCIHPIPKQPSAVQDNSAVKDVLLTMKSSAHPISPSLIYWVIRPFETVRFYSKN